MVQCAPDSHDTYLSISAFPIPFPQLAQPLRNPLTASSHGTNPLHPRSNSPRSSTSSKQNTWRGTSSSPGMGVAPFFAMRCRLFGSDFDIALGCDFDNDFGSDIGWGRTSSSLNSDSDSDSTREEVTAFRFGNGDLEARSEEAGDDLTLSRGRSSAVALRRRFSAFPLEVEGLFGNCGRLEEGGRRDLREDEVDGVDGVDASRGTDFLTVTREMIGPLTGCLSPKKESMVGKGQTRRAD